MNGRKIDASIAVVFEAADFWTDDKNKEQADRADQIAVYFERLRKRKKPWMRREDAEPPELFDLPQTPAD